MSTKPHYIDCPKCDGQGGDVWHSGDDWDDRGNYKAQFSYGSPCDLCEGSGRIEDTAAAAWIKQQDGEEN